MRTVLIARARVALRWAAVSLVLFVLQLIAIAYGSLVPFQSLAPHGGAAWEALGRSDASSLFLGAAPAGLAAYFAARVLAISTPSCAPGPSLAGLALGMWLGVWVGGWLALYLLFVGANFSAWAFAPFARPQLWYGLVLVAAGLWAGVRARQVV